jgi:molybdopterin molybdotransferase
MDDIAPAASLNDCFAAPDKLISLDRALAFLTERVAPVTGTETVPLAQCAGRILARDVVAKVTAPPFANAAMDGFAFRHEDARGGPLKVVDRIAAGHPSTHRFGPGEAARIFTGAPMPDGLDTVAMQEDCTTASRDGAEHVTLPHELKAGANIHPAGNDYSAGQVVVRAGRRLRPQDVGMAASAGHPNLLVHQRLKVAVFSTGDEVVEPGEKLSPGSIYSSNRHALMALAAGLGCAIEDIGNLPDDLDRTASALKDASDRADLLITTGGVSVGGEDHVRAAVERYGAIHLWRMLIKPGKPTALGHVGKAAFVGLPGYPVSCQVMFMIFARPVILRLAGAVAEPSSPVRFRVASASSYAKGTARREFVRARLTPGADGALRAELYRKQDSSVLSSLVESDGLVDLREDTKRIEPGEMVDFIPFAALHW